VNRDHRRLLALFLALFGMALISSAANAGPVCAADSGSAGTALCDLTSAGAPPAPVDRALYDVPAAPPLLAAEAGDSPAAIVLRGQDSLAEQDPASGLLLGLAWNMDQHDDAALASAR
jgi:hypothetical protein